ncbi:MAG: GNAT family N-acetyltransferase [Proteobacteria bacterium]|nr:GNAT family N-acetyltransferase [Pseudomonadota bacterium]
MIEYFDLRERSHHVDGMAERIWAAFWRHKGAPLTAIRAGLEDFLRPDSRIPFAIVAECEGRLCGNALVIDNDEPARPDLTPWLAALWVDEPFRGRGIAAGLLGQGLRRCAALGVGRLHLVSRPALRDFYVKLGWQVLEDAVGAHRLTLYGREPGAVLSRP